VLFAALFLLALMALAIRALVDGLARRMVPWIEETEA
jgi:ABC-type nitrate/sulfonate/bicarbonate transport system permease component